MKSKTHPGALAACLVCAVSLLAAAGVARADGPRDHALFSAIRSGDLAVLESHLREGTPLNVQAADGTTPLALAALYGTADTVRLLLDHGADPNAAGQAGASPLLLAAGDLEKVRLLVARGADVNARSKLGNTPLIAAAAHVGNLDVVKLLLDHGADPQAKNRNAITVLTSAVSGNDANIVRLLVARGCKPAKVFNLFGATGNSPLELAVENGNSEIVEILLADGADVNSGDSNFAGHALNYALLSQKPDIARRLIEAGADLKLVSPVGKVPPIVLSAYSETGDTSVTKLLLERGADAQAASQSGETVLTWARRRGFPAVIAQLAAAGAPEVADRRVAIPNRDLKIDADNRAGHVHTAIEKSISLMQRSSDEFLKIRRSCVSCHHHNLPAVAIGWARDRGFAVDAKSVELLVERQQTSWSRRLNSIHEMDSPFPVPPQFLGYGLWGFSALGIGGDTLTDATVWYLAATQQPDGHWLAGFSRPPMGDGDILSTVLAMRALQLYPPPAMRDEMRTRVARARRWLADAKPALHQERVYKLLGLAWAGIAADQLQDELETLRAAQQADGGWGQLTHMPSDAWATGQALVALGVAGRIPSGDPAYQRGVDYLVRTQFDDGSWYVLSRAWPFQPPFDSGFPFDKDQWISAGATAWATMAMLLTVEPSKPTVVPSRSDSRPDPLPLAAVSSAPEKPSEPAAPKSEPQDFARHIKPILERSCVGCHRGDTPEGGFRLTTRELLLQGGESGEAAVVSGQSGQSPLVNRISTTDGDLAMPPPDKRDKYPALSADEVQTIRAWIEQGATWPADVSIKSESD
jgi:ankyrin repeat protein/mono/diheme cytochrome c family protein